METLQHKTEENSFAKHGEKRNPFKPTAAFIGASWFALLIGMTSYCIGLWNAGMRLDEKGYYFTILLFGLFAVISVQKSVRDRAEGLAVTDLYYGLSWFATIAAMIFIDRWPLECKYHLKRERLLRHGILPKHVCGHCRTKKYPRRKIVRGQRTVT